MNNEPVAWMTHLIRYDNLAGKIAIPQLHLTLPPPSFYDEIIPLYTHLVKELTDEEIEEFAYAFELWQLHNPDKALEGIKDFARAILRKAQEK